MVKLNTNTLEALKKAVSGTSIESDFTEEEIESIFNNTEDIMVLRELNFVIDDLAIGEGTIGEMNDNIIVCKYKKNKGWFIKGTKTRVIVGYARAYRNPSF